MVMLTYASDRPEYSLANELIRTVSAKLSLPLIDVRPRFATLCPTVECPALLLPDGHPNAQGYVEFAQLVAAGLRANRWPGPAPP